MEASLRRAVEWEPLKAKTRPPRLIDQRHLNWEVEAGVLPGYDGLLEIRARYREDFEVVVVFNDRMEQVSSRVVDPGDP